MVSAARVGDLLARIREPAGTSHIDQLDDRTIVSVIRLVNQGHEPASRLFDQLDDHQYVCSSRRSMSRSVGERYRGPISALDINAVSTRGNTMSEPTKPATTADDVQAPVQKKGGFGQFAELYRARWAANHPNMRPRESGAPNGPTPEQTPTPPATAPADVPARGSGGSRLFRPED
jgi:hypothetical protein